MKILYIGQFNDACGYGNAARKYLRVLNEDKYFQDNLILIPVNAEKKNFASEEDSRLIEKYHFKDEELKKIIDSGEYITLVHFLPTIHEHIKHILKNSKKTYSLVYTEVDRVAEKWIDIYKNSQIYDEIITASKWNQEIFSRDTELKTHLIHIPFEKINIDYKQDDKFTVFSMSQWVPRKGFDAVIKAFTQEFFHNSDVRLIIKTYRAEVMKNSSEENEKQAILSDALKYKNQIFDFGRNSNVEIFIVTGHLPEEQIKSLYSKSNVFCSGAKAEGFGITIADACSFAIPCIALKYTGHVDFLDKKNSFLYEGTLTPVANDSFFLVSKDMNLYEPNILDLRKQLRICYNIWKNNKEDLKQIGLKNREYAMDVLNPQVVLKKFKEVLNIN